MERLFQRRLPALFVLKLNKVLPMSDTISLDKETASDLNLLNVGLDAYSNHPSTRVLMVAYRINKGRLQHWEAHKRRLPAELKEALEDPEVIKKAFNAQFERRIAVKCLGIKTPRKGWRCTMTLAYMMSFMGGLEDVGVQIGIPLDLQKQKDGKRLIRKFSNPQKISRNQPNLWRNWITD